MEVFDLRLQLAARAARQSGSAVKSNAAAGGGSTNKFGGISVGPFRMQEPAKRFPSGDERVGSHLNLPHQSCTFSELREQQKNGDGGVVPVQREGDTHAKQIKDVPVVDDTKAYFPAQKRNFLCPAKSYGSFEIFTEGEDAHVANEGMSIPTVLESFHAGVSPELSKGVAIATL